MSNTEIESVGRITQCENEVKIVEKQKESIYYYCYYYYRYDKFNKIAFSNE